MTPLAQMLVAFEQKHDLAANAVAAGIGINESTYCRIKQGKTPDAQNLAKIISWMVETPEI